MNLFQEVWKHLQAFQALKTLESLVSKKEKTNDDVQYAVVKSYREVQIELVEQSSGVWWAALYHPPLEEGKCYGPGSVRGFGSSAKEAVDNLNKKIREGDFLDE